VAAVEAKKYGEEKQRERRYGRRKREVADGSGGRRDEE